MYSLTQLLKEKISLKFRYKLATIRSEWTKLSGAYTLMSISAKQHDALTGTGGY